jgi:hypothetical protein
MSLFPHSSIRWDVPFPRYVPGSKTATGVEDGKSATFASNSSIESTTRFHDSAESVAPAVTLSESESPDVSAEYPTESVPSTQNHAAKSIKVFPFMVD